MHKNQPNVRFLLDYVYKPQIKDKWWISLYIQSQFKLLLYVNGCKDDLATENIKERLLLHLNDWCHEMSDIFSKEAYTATSYTPIK